MKKILAVMPYIDRVRNIVCGMLGIDKKTCTDEDVSLLMSYTLGHKLNSKPDLFEIAKDMNGLVEKHGDEYCVQGVLAKVAVLNDRHSVVSNPFRVVHPLHSETFAVEIEAMRKQKMRDYFLRLSKSVIRLNAAVATLTDSLRHDKPKHVLKKDVNEIRRSIQSCEYHLKSGIAMALASGVHPHSVWKATHGLYELRAAKMAKLFVRVDLVLEAKGVNSTLSKTMNKRQSAWLNNWRGIFESYRRERMKDNDVSAPKIA